MAVGSCPALVGAALLLAACGTRPQPRIVGSNQPEAIPPAAAGSQENMEAGAEAGVDSAYTDLDLAHCQAVGDGPAWRCPGLGDVPLFVAASDGRFDVDAGVQRQGGEGPLTAGAAPTRIEWRLRAGVPIAIIYRLAAVGPSASILMIKTVGRQERPGCLIGRIDGGAPDANAHARRIADAHAADVRCKGGEPDTGGN